MKTVKFTWNKKTLTVFSAYDFASDQIVNISPSATNGTLGSSSLLNVKKFDQIEVSYEYLQLGTPNEPVWYYGHVVSSDENSFPAVPKMGLIPVSYVIENSERDIEFPSEDILFKSDLVSLSCVWPSLVHKELASSDDLSMKTQLLKSQLADITNEVNNSVANMEGSYDRRSHQEVNDLSLRVDKFIREINFKDVLVRNEDMSLCYKSGNMTDYHEKVIERRDRLAIENPFRPRASTVTGTPTTPGVIISSSSYAEIKPQQFSLFLKLESLKFKVTPNKKHWLRVCVYPVDGTHKGNERPVDVKHDAFMIPIQIYRLNINADGSTSEPVAEKEDIVKYLNPFTSSCLFEHLMLKNQDGRLLIFCDLMVQNKALDVIATTKEPS
ncbi:uncharacterized protein LOC142346209 [Convolutriloba macropyga]|uniref:uncharacterized protein LOC142346209 n=1 Tax=Convolutriloba macropyga TaxID=536237 RepID=UPI003F526D4B